MRFKGKKWASPLFIVSLAVAGIFGASAGIVDKQVKENAITEKSDAMYDTGTSNKNYYLNLAGFTSWENKGDGVNPKFVLENWTGSNHSGTKHWDDFSKITVLGDSNSHLYKASINQRAWSFYYKRVKSTDSTEWNTCSYDDLYHAGQANVYKVSGWNNGGFDSDAYNIFTCTLSDNHGSGSTMTLNGDTLSSGNYGYVYRHVTYNLTAGTPNPGYRFKNWTLSGNYATIASTTSATTTISSISDDITVTANFEKVTDNGCYLVGDFNSWSTTSNLIAATSQYRDDSGHQHFCWAGTTFTAGCQFVAVYLNDGNATWYNPGSDETHSISVDAFNEFPVYSWYNSGDGTYRCYIANNSAFDIDLDVGRNPVFYTFKISSPNFKVKINTGDATTMTRSDIYDDNNTTQYQVTLTGVTLKPLDTVSFVIYGTTVTYEHVSKLSGGNLFGDDTNWRIMEQVTSPTITVKMGKADGKLYTTITGAAASNDYWIVVNDTTPYHTTYSSSAYGGKTAYVIDAYLTTSATQKLKIYNAYTGTFTNFSSINASSVSGFSITSSVLTCNTAGTYYFEIQRTGDTSGAYTKVYIDKSQFTFSFNMHGHGTQIASRTVERQHTTSAPTAPTATGYTFGGWYKEDSYTNSWVFASDKVTTDTTVHAKWTAKTSALTFNLNGGSGTAATGLTATYGSNMPSYTQAAPTKAGYTFLGFYDGTGDGAVQYYTSALASARTWNKDTTSGTTLYAKWSQNSFTVTINVSDARYGSVNKTSITNVPYGSTVSISNNTLTINGTTVTATVETPPAGYKNSFVEWTNAPATITSAITITATFSQVSGRSAAQDYAIAFNNAISDVCDYYGGTNVEALAEVWSEQDAAYDGLEAYVQYWVLNDGTVPTIVSMRAKYDYVYGKYGEDIGDDFLNRNPASVSAVRDFKPFSLFGDDEEALTNGVIIASSSIAFVSIAALSLLVIKKKKLKK